MAPKEIGETIQAALEQHASPKPTVLKERHKLHWLRQKDGEETGVFFSRLRQQALKCCFDADQLDERIRDQFVFGIKSVDARVVKPARLHFARAARALAGRYMCGQRVGEAFSPNIQPRAHARLTGLTNARKTLLGEDIDKLEIKTVFEKVIAIERSKKEAQEIRDAHRPSTRHAPSLVCSLVATRQSIFK